MPQNLQDWLREVGRRGDRGVWFAERLHPYDELIGAARGTASSLVRLGLRPGDAVGLVLETGHDLVRLLLGVWLAGAIPVCLAPPSRFSGASEQARNLVRMVQAASCRRVVAGPEVSRELIRAGLSLPTLEPADVSSDGPWLPIPDPDPGELALIQFSSGTTRCPAPVGLTHRNLRSNVEAILAALPGPLSRHSCLSWLPFHHDMGLIGGFLCTLAGQGNLTLMPPEEFAFRPGRWLQALSRTRATISPAPNFALALCLERVRERELENVDLGAWEIALVGAEPVQLGTLERFAERFAPFGFRWSALTPVYGLAEATLAVTFSLPADAPRSTRVDPQAMASSGRALPGARPLVSVGRPVQGVQVEVRRNGRPVEEGPVGTVYVRGDSVMEGYVGMPERTRAVLRDGWLDTGDLGFWRDGELYLCGREKDLLILQGRNHDPSAVEEAVERLGAHRVAAFSAEDPARGTESLYLLVEQARLDGAAREFAGRAREAVVQATGLVPEAVHVLEPGTLPCTTSGKVRRGEARHQFFRGQLVPLGSSFRDP